MFRCSRRSPRLAYGSSSLVIPRYASSSISTTSSEDGSSPEDDDEIPRVVVPRAVGGRVRRSGRYVRRELPIVFPQRGPQDDFDEFHNEPSLAVKTGLALFFTLASKPKAQRLEPYAFGNTLFDSSVTTLSPVFPHRFLEYDTSGKEDLERDVQVVCGASSRPSLKDSLWRLVTQGVLRETHGRNRLNYHSHHIPYSETQNKERYEELRIPTSYKRCALPTDQPLVETRENGTTQNLEFSHTSVRFAGIDKTKFTELSSMKDDEFVLDNDTTLGELKSGVLSAVDALRPLRYLGSFEADKALRKFATTELRHILITHKLYHENRAIIESADDLNALVDGFYEHFKDDESPGESALKLLMSKDWLAAYEHGKEVMESVQKSAGDEASHELAKAIKEQNSLWEAIRAKDASSGEKRANSPTVQILDVYEHEMEGFMQTTDVIRPVDRFFASKSEQASIPIKGWVAPRALRVLAVVSDARLGAPSTSLDTCLIELSANMRWSDVDGANVVEDFIVSDVQSVVAEHREERVFADLCSIEYGRYYLERLVERITFEPDATRLAKEWGWFGRDVPFFRRYSKRRYQENRDVVGENRIIRMLLDVETAPTIGELTEAIGALPLDDDGDDSEQAYASTYLDGRDGATRKKALESYAEYLWTLMSDMHISYSLFPEIVYRRPPPIDMETTPAALAKAVIQGLETLDEIRPETSVFPPDEEKENAV